MTDDSTTTEPGPAVGGAPERAPPEVVVPPATPARRSRGYRVQSEAQRREQAFLDAMSRRTPRVFVVPALIALNTAVFVAMVATSGKPLEFDAEHALAWGADFGPQTTTGEWWRVVTSAFVHINVEHFLLNMLCLWRLGPIVERMFGHAAFLALYLFAAVSGSLFSLLHHPELVSAGASGAIFGVAGAFIASVVRHRAAVPLSLLWRVNELAGGFFIWGILVFGPLVFVAYNVAFGVLGELTGESLVDNAAHVGGLFGGSLAALALDPGFAADARSLRTGAWRRFALACAALVALLPTTYLRARASTPVAEYLHGAAALESEQRGDWKRALEQYSAWVDASPDSVEARLGRCRARIEVDQHSGALEDADAAIAIEPASSAAHRHRGWALEALERPADAETAYTRAIELDRTDAYSHSRRGWLLLAQQKPELARADFEACVKYEPADPAHLYSLAAALGELGEAERAEETLTRCLARDAKSEAALWARAFCRVQLRDGDGALRDVEACEQLGPPSSQSCFVAHYALRLKDDLRGALARLESSRQLGLEAHVYELNVGTLEHMQGNVEPALRAYERALASKGDFAEARLARTIALYDRGDFRAVLADTAAWPSDAAEAAGLAHVLRWLARRRLEPGGDADQALVEYSSSHVHDDAAKLPVEVAAFCLKELDESALLARVQAAKRSGVKRPLGRALYYVGAVRELQGDAAAAKTAFERAWDEGSRESVEAASARGRVRRSR